MRINNISTLDGRTLANLYMFFRRRFNVVKLTQTAMVVRGIEVV